LILCVAIGNTNIRYAAGTTENFAQAVMPTEELSCRDKFKRFIENNFGVNIWRQLQGCIISSVVPQKKLIIVEFLHQLNNKLSVQYIDTENKNNDNIDFSQYKSRLGEDRAVCCTAAAVKYKTSVIVIDLGTATTINIINKDNVFLGGAILTGVQTGLAALSKQTAQLPLINDFSGVKVIGSNTRECLISGASIGTACMIEGYISRIKEELGNEPTIVITGGNAPQVMPFCNFDFVYEPSLLIEGLFLLYQAAF